jgi:hypothetical protein
VTEFRSNRPTLDRVLAQAELRHRLIKATGANPARAVRIELGVGWFEASPVLTTEMP